MPTASDYGVGSRERSATGAEGGYPAGLWAVSTRSQHPLAGVAVPTAHSSPSGSAVIADRLLMPVGLGPLGVLTWVHWLPFHRAA